VPLGKMDPKIAEKEITSPIEIAVNNIKEVKTIESRTDSQFAIIVVHLDWQSDLNQKARQISDMVQKYNALLYRWTPGTSPVFRFDIYAQDNFTGDLPSIVTDLKQKISRIKGVGRVQVDGLIENQILIKLKTEQLQRLQIPYAYVYQILKDHFSIKRFDQIQIQKANHQIALKATKEEIRAISNISIPYQVLYKVRPQTPHHVSHKVPHYKPMSFIKLTDIANIQEQKKPAKSYARTNRHDSISLSIIKETKANTLYITQKISTILKQFVEDHPKLATLISLDDSHYIKDSQSTLITNMIIGSMLTIILVFLFLKNFTSTIIICVTIPLSLSFTFIAMYLAGVSKNILSLAGLSLGIGMVIDCSISTVASIIQSMKSHKGQPWAAIQGAKEIAFPILSSILTSLAVFVPILFLQDIIGALFRDLALTIIFSLSFSYFISILFVPALSSSWITNGSSKKLPTRLTIGSSPTNATFQLLLKLKKFGNNCQDWIIRSTVFMLKNFQRRILLLSSILLLIIVAIYNAPALEFLPTEKPSSYLATFSFSQNAPIISIKETMEQMENKLYEYIDIKSSFITINPTETLLTFVPQNPPLNEQEITRYLGSELEEINPGAKVSINAFSRFNEKKSKGTPLEIKIAYTDQKDLQQKEKQLLRVLKQIPTVHNIKNLNKLETTVFQVRPNQETLRTKQISSQLLKDTMFLKNNSLPLSSTVILKSNENILHPHHKQGTENFRFKETTTKQTIFHHDLHKVAFFQANFDSNAIPTSVITQKIKTAIPQPWIILVGQSQTITESFQKLKRALLISLILVFTILALQFGSLIHSITILFTFLLTFLGAIPGLILCQEFTSAPAMIGIIMLSGITVNNGILLVDHIITRRKQYLDPITAIVKAIETRIIPIITTSLTTIVGLLPMVMGIGSGSEIYRGLAIVLVFGLLVSSTLCLMVVPIFYLTIEEFSELTDRAWVRLIYYYERSIGHIKKTGSHL